jgi:hypothetical protein
MNPQTQSIVNHQLVDPCQGCVLLAKRCWLWKLCPSIANEIPIQTLENTVQIVEDLNSKQLPLLHYLPGA